MVCHERTIGKLLKQLGFSHISARPRQPADQRYENAYLFGAICSARGVGAALAMPFAETAAMQAHLDEISRVLARGAHAVLLLDRAGRHTTGKLQVPRNMTRIFLPSRSPELNSVENIWQYLRANWLSNRVFDAYPDIIEVDAKCPSADNATLFCILRIQRSLVETTRRPTILHSDEQTIRMALSWFILYAIA